MFKKFSKWAILAFGITALNAGEIEIGKGTFEISGGFIGLDRTIDADIDTYSLIEQHKSIFKSTWFYRYNITWYDSKDMVSRQNQINGYLNNFSNTFITPSIDYSLLLHQRIISTFDVVILFIDKADFCRLSQS